MSVRDMMWDNRYHLSDGNKHKNTKVIPLPAPTEPGRLPAAHGCAATLQRKMARIKAMRRE